MSLEISSLWWGLPGPSGFSDTLCTCLEEGSLILCLEDPIPWPQTLWDEVTARCGAAIRRLSWTGDTCAGDFILRSLFSPRQRAYYFPDVSYGSYISSLPAQTEIIRISGVRSPAHLAQWVEVLEDYAGPLRFLVEYQGSGGVSRGVPLRCHRIDPNQLRGFTLLLASKLNNTSLVRYQAELACQISRNDPQLCAELLLLGEDLLLDPVASARAFGIDACRTESACHQAALTAVFPLIEDCRFRYIRRHRDALSCHLPIRNVGGELIDSPYDLEIGHVNYLIRHQPLLEVLEGSDQIRLCAMVRNQIAHNKRVACETLRVLMDMPPIPEVSP